MAPPLTPTSLTWATWRETSGFSVLNVLDSLALAEKTKPWTRRLFVYHPSALKGCKRALYYDRIGLPPEDNFRPETHALFNLGHALHEMLQAQLAKWPGFIAEGQADYEPLFISGNFDGVFPEEDWLLEIKTVGHASYTRLTKPPHAHMLQAHCYMMATGVRRIQMLYLDRDVGTRKLYRVLFNEAVWQEVVDIINSVEPFVQRREPPAHEPVPRVCRECKFFNACKPPLGKGNAGSLPGGTGEVGGSPRIKRVLATRRAVRARAALPVHADEGDDT